MIIDNGTHIRLVISGVFDGVAGFSRGRVAFRPNRRGNKPEQAHGALVNGEPALISDIRLEGEGPSYSAVCELLS